MCAAEQSQQIKQRNRKQVVSADGHTEPPVGDANVSTGSVIPTRPRGVRWRARGAMNRNEQPKKQPAGAVDCAWKLWRY